MMFWSVKLNEVGDCVFYLWLTVILDVIVISSFYYLTVILNFVPWW